MKNELTVGQKSAIGMLARRVGTVKHVTMTALVRRGYAVWNSPAKATVRLTAAGAHFAATGEQLRG